MQNRPSGRFFLFDSFCKLSPCVVVFLMQAMYNETIHFHFKGG